MIDSLSSRWDGLLSDPMRSVFQLYDSDHPMDFYIGKSTKGNRLLMLVVPEKPPAIKDMRSISIRSFLRDDSKWALLLSLEDIHLNPIFSLLCSDLLEFSRVKKKSNTNSFNMILTRLSNWRRLLEKGVPELMSENSIRGLCGELLIFQRLASKVGHHKVIKSWVGPLKSEQDFQASDKAWEVKTIRPGAENVFISSELQLQSTSRQVFLVVVELVEVEAPLPGKAFTLNSLVEDIRIILEPFPDSADLFEERLILAGYISMAEYSELLFIEKNSSVYAVGNAFPCITKDNIGFGVCNVNYEIELSACKNFQVDLNEHFGL